MARFAAVQSVIQARQAGQTLAAALSHAQTQAWGVRQYSYGTIEEWYYAYRSGQFAALKGRRRTDLGKSLVLAPEQVEELLKLRRANPEVTLAALAQELERRGVVPEGACSLSTLQRRVREAGLDRRSLRLGTFTAGSGPQKAFELPLPNLLWMTDCMHGKPIKTAKGLVKTYLFAIIDDCTRLCVYACYYTAEKLHCFLDCLRTAVETRGVPAKLYTDNGAAFKSLQLSVVCANLGVSLLHCRPYHSWSKGKIERFFRTVHDQFEAKLTFEPVDSIEALNRALWKWVEGEYHQAKHSAMDGESPAARFSRLGQGVRLLIGNEPLDRWFGMREVRSVRKDATLHLKGGLREVPAYLRGQKVVVHYDPVGFTRVEIEHQGRMLGVVQRVDKNRNAQLKEKRDEHDQIF